MTKADFLNLWNDPGISMALNEEFHDNIDRHAQDHEEDQRYGMRKYQYTVIIKSHCEAPDYEDFVVALEDDEAVEMFKNKGLQFDDEFIRKNWLKEEME